MAGSSGKKKTTSTSKKNTASRRTRKQETGFLQSEVAVLGTFAVSVFLFLSNFHICGFIGDFLSQIMLGVFGTIGYVAPVLLFAGMIFYASNKGNVRAVYKMLAVELLLFILCGLAQLTLGGGFQEGQTLGQIYAASGKSGLGGGLIGGVLVLLLHTAVGTIGAYLILLVALIICLVCITEKSFVSAVKKGSGKAYQYAREDYDRRKEIREERRLLKEEQKVHGVNLGSTDLSKETSDRSVMASGEVSADTEDRKAENAVSAEDRKEAAAAADRADIFVGSIASPLKNAEEDVVPFEEDTKPSSASGRDEDIFLSRDTRTLEEMELFSGTVSAESGREAAENSGCDEDQVPWEEASSSESSDMELHHEETENSRDRHADRQEEPADSGLFHTPEERKTVVTASGKVIETDTEEIVKKKMEKRKMDAAERADSEQSVQAEIRKTEEKKKKEYIFPPLTLLTRQKGTAEKFSDREYRETAIKLQQTLRNFGVGVTVTNISCGPTVTRYELHPEQGVKVSRILALADDIKLNLAAADIRIEAPIPGKAAVGIEVPNKVNSTVYLRELLESDEFRKHPSRLAFAVGKDIGGQVIVADLAKMPHLLIAGQTGSGKSVGINTMIMSLIYRSSPDDVKLIMIDPKVVELSVYNGIPHLLIPVVTDPKKAAGALNWAVAEMTERYKKFADCNVRDLKGYNARVKKLEESGDVSPEEIPAKLPQIVIIIDELADLMMVASGEVEDAICRLAQLARAAGIHLVIATQRPSVNVITGVIKANVPSRIAFSVASGVDSRTIIDMNGAEKLLGNGDMLFYPSGYPKPVRVQGAFVSDSEVSRVTDFLKEQWADTQYDAQIEAKMNQPVSGSGQENGSDRDVLFTDAGRFIIEKDKASIGMLQRMFKIGFNRAARIMDQLAEAGVVGEEEGTKPRKILMSMEEFEELIESGY